MCETEANMSLAPYAPSTPSRSQSPSFCSESQQYPSTPELSNRYSPNLVKRMETSTCYTCGQIGHWSWDCPHKNSNNNTKPFNNNSHSATDRVDEEKMWETEVNMSLPPYAPSTPSRSESQSPSFCSQSQLYPSTPELSNRYSPNLVKRMENSTCYTCGQIGHWSWDCPHKISNNNTKPFNNDSHSATDRMDEEKMCETETNMSPPPYAPSTPSRSESQSQSPSFCSESQPYPSTPELSNRYSPNLVKRMENSTCYTCGQIGHWSGDCPSKNSNNNAKPFNNDSHSAKKLWHCRCGHGFWEEKTAKNDRNYGKMYYACPIKRGAKCKGFIQWCEDPIDSSYLQPPPFKYPECECGAGVCRRVEGTLNHTVKYYFTCPIKQKHGSCGYVVREDELLDNIRTVQPSCKRSLNVCLEGEQNDQSQTDDEFGEGGSLLVTHWKRTRVMDSSEITTFMSVSQANLSQRKDAVLKKARPLSCLSRPSRISQENAFQRHILDGGAAAADESFGFCPMGWLGRLVYFHPTQSMKFPSSKPIFCCVFPSFNPIVVPEQESITDDPCGFSSLRQQQTQLSTPCGFSSLSQQQTQLSTPCGFSNLSQQQTQLSTPSGFSSLSQQTQLSTVCGFINLSQQTQLSTAYHTEPSSDDVSPKMSQGSERKLRSKAQRQRQMAFVAQQQLLMDLIALEPHEHESMREAANDTFDMLDNLGATDKQFCELIWNFINLTSLVAQMTQTIENSLTPEELNKCLEEEKARLDHIQNEYVKTEALLKVSDQRRQSLCKDISELETMLHEKQNQLKFCELETLNIEIELGDLKCNMFEAESVLKSRTEQAKVAEELMEGIREIQVWQIVAKTALKKATVGLEYFNNLSIV